MIIPNKKITICKITDRIISLFRSIIYMCHLGLEQQEGNYEHNPGVLILSIA